MLRHTLIKYDSLWRETLGVPRPSTKWGLRQRYRPLLSVQPDDSASTTEFVVCSYDAA